MSKYRAPNGLGAAGLALWRRFTADEDLVFSTSELVTLELAARQADDVHALETALQRDGLVTEGSKGQPKLSSIPGELRLQRAALARLVGLLAFPEEGESEGLTPAQKRARRAADARWSRSAAAREARRG